MITDEASSRYLIPFKVGFPQEMNCFLRLLQQGLAEIQGMRQAEVLKVIRERGGQSRSRRARGE